MGRAFAFVSVLASIITILCFATGWLSIGDILKAWRGLASHDNPDAAEAPPHPEPERQDLNNFSPLIWLPDQKDGAQKIYAQRPAGLFRSRQFVLLECDIERKCIVTPIFKIPNEIPYVDKAILSQDGNIALLNRFGDGLLFHQSDRKYTLFHFALPCANDASFSGDGTPPGGNYSVQEAYLRQNSLFMRLQGRDCHGLVKIGDTTKDAGSDFTTFQTGRTFFEFDLRLDFDDLGYIRNSDASLYRAEANLISLPIWFSYNSLRNEKFYNENQKNKIHNSEIIEKIKNSLRLHSSSRLYIAPDIPRHIRFNAYIIGKLNSDQLISVMDLSINGDAFDGIFFTPSGILVVEGQIPSRLITYSSIISQKPSAGFLGGVEVEGFHVSTNSVSPNEVVNTISDVALSSLNSEPTIKQEPVKITPNTDPIGDVLTDPHKRPEVVPVRPVQDTGEVASCMRYANGNWNTLSDGVTLTVCTHALFEGICVKSDEANYGRWGEMTLRLRSGGLIEASSDNKNFHQMMQQHDACTAN